MFHAFQETFVQHPGFAFEHAALHGNPCRHQPQQAFACNFRIRVLHGRNHARDPGIDQCIGTRRSPPLMAARFEGDVSGGVEGLVARLSQRMHFGVRLTGANMPALADDLSIAHDHATHARVGVRGVNAFARQFQCARHVMVVQSALLSRWQAHSFTGSRARRSISSRNSLRSWKRR